MKKMLLVTAIAVGLNVPCAAERPGGDATGGMFPIRVNQAGYLPDAPKFCLMRNPSQAEFYVQAGATDICWHTVFTGKWRDAPSGNGLKIGDFSAIRTPGDYRILCGDISKITRFRMPDWRPEIQSYHFQIRTNVYDTALRQYVGYLTWQRCGHRLGWAGECHQDPVPVVDAQGNTVRMLDARGGYHQSADLRKWHDGISCSIYALIRFAEMKKPLWDDGIIESEIRWGCDYFRRVIAPEGYVYDAQFVPIGWGPRRYYLAPAALGGQCNVVMTLARASRYFRARDIGYAEDCLRDAKRVFTNIETNSFFARAQPSPEKNLPAGSQPSKFYLQQYRTSANGLSERACAALELYRATDDPAYARMAKDLGARFVACLRTEGPKAGFARLTLDSEDDGLTDCGYCFSVSGYRTPLELYRTFREDRWHRAAETIAAARARILLARDGFPRREGDRGSPSTAASWSLYLNECAGLFNRPEWRILAQRALDWVYGCNRWNRSFVEGVGQNQWQRPVFGQFFPSTPQIPGGVLHVPNGEYDMPAVTRMLWATAALEADSL